MHTERKKSGGARKLGRNLAKCDLYRKRGIRERNKRRRLTRHCSGQPNDKVAARCLEGLG